MPAIAREPARAAPALTATLNVTTPLPTPRAPPVTTRCGALLSAVQEQVALVVTAMVDVPAAAPRFTLIDDSE